MKRLALIPARGGSKRIPRKNLRPFHGAPILSYSVKAALASGLFEEVMVSTDDEEISRLALSLGASVPFTRSSENATDEAGTAPVVLEVLECYRRAGEEFEEVCCLYPTAPFVTATMLQKAASLLESSESEGVVTVLPYSYPIQRALTIENGHVRMVEPANMFLRSQNCAPRYHDAGQFYFFRTEAFLSQKRLFLERASPLLLSPLEAQDIDSEDDWKLAELKFQLLLSR